MPNFIAGWNTPGYLPDMDPMDFDTSEEALEFLRDACVQHFEDDEDIPDTVVDECRTGVKTWRTDDAGEFGITVGPIHYWISREAA
jgi:hypothetical protein